MYFIMLATEEEEIFPIDEQIFDLIANMENVKYQRVIVPKGTQEHFGHVINLYKRGAVKIECRVYPLEGYEIQPPPSKGPYKAH